MIPDTEPPDAEPSDAARHGAQTRGAETPATVIRVAVIDNDRLVPAGLRALLAEHDDIVLVRSSVDVTGHRAAEAEAIAGADSHSDSHADSRTDVVLLDLMLEDGTSPAANVAALRADGARVLVISVHGERRHVRATLRAGAGGYLVKDDDAAKLAEAVRTVHAGGLALTTELMTLINDDPPELSPQELQVLYLYGTGSTLAATARRLGITISAVRSYLERIRAKWAAAEEPVEDVRTLIDVYPPRPPHPPSPVRPSSSPRPAPPPTAAS
jgi:DNA-binding NarL/FixJ family response regulator